MITSICTKLLPLVSRSPKFMFTPSSRHFAWFKSKYDSSTKADTTKIQVVFVPEMLPDGPADNPALVLPKGEQQFIPFNEITPISSLRAFLKNVTQFDASLEEIISDADKLTPQQIMDKIDSALVLMRYNLNLGHVLTHAYPSDYKYGVLDDMYHSYLKHDVNRFNPLTYYTACALIECTKSTNDELKQLGQFYRSQGKLYGFHLDVSGQEVAAEYCGNIQKHVKKFISNVNTCIYKESVPISDENVIKALPESFSTKLFMQSAIRLPLHPTAYEIFMTFCPDKAIRRQVYVAYNSKPQMVGGKNNSVEFEKARDYRHKLSNTLGYINYSEMTVSRKMAGSVEVVKNMLNSMSQRISAKYNQDLQELDDEKGRKSIGKLEPWDLLFLKNISLRKKFGAKTDVARYFPLDKVISGTFQLIENIFNVKVEQVDSDKCQLWSQHVKFYRLIDNDGQILGHFYFDPYCQRGADRFGSNIIELTNRSKTLGTTPLAAAFLSKKVPIAKEQRILLSYPEYLSFLSMMGRILTIVMTRNNYFELSTMYNVPKDRLDSLGHALLLYGLHNHDAVQLCSANVTNGEPLPNQIHDLLRQYILSYESIGLNNDLFLSALDIALYTNTEFWRDILPEVWNKYMNAFELPKEYAYPLSFNEIVSNDGASSYYSKIWSQMIGSDICSAFLESGTNDGLKETGKKLRNTILSSGSSLASADLFREFRGRDPSLAPFLELHDLFIQPKLTQS